MTTQTRLYSMDDLYGHRYQPLSTLDLSRVSDTARAYGADLTVQVNNMLNDLSEEITLPRAIWGGSKTVNFQDVGEFGEAKPEAEIGGQELHFPLFKLQAAEGMSEEAWNRALVQDLLDAMVAMDTGYQARVQKEMKAAIFNNTLFTKQVDVFSREKSTLNLIQPFLNGDSGQIPPAPSGKTFAAGSQNHYIGITGSSLAVTDVDYLVNHVREHGDGQLVLYVDPAMPTTLAGLSNTPYLAATPVTVLDNSAAQMPRFQTSITSDGSNADVGLWRGNLVKTRSWVPVGYIFCANISSPIGKPLRRRIDPLFPGLITDTEISNGIIRIKKSHFYMGFGAWNRSAGAVLDTATQGSYTVPTGLVRK